MRARYLIPLALALVGCSAPPPNAGRLTAVQADALAEKLANEKAHILYGIQPFRNGPPVEFIHGRWVWHDLRGSGSGDIEATVEFAADGAKPTVSVKQLHSGLLREF
jgi:hypothetical protein